MTVSSHYQTQPSVPFPRFNPCSSFFLLLDLLGGNRLHRPSLQGSVFWMAPEVVKQTGHTKKADIWSVGCLVVEMLTGEHPWAQLTQMQAIFKVRSPLPLHKYGSNI